MADRQVRRTGKDSDGDIIRLCGPTWGSAGKHQAITEIETGLHTYFVQEPGAGRANVHVVKGSHGKHLRTGADAASANNLDNLPDC